MVKITRLEAEQLYACGRGRDIHISSKTHKSRAKRYYLTESSESMRLLNDFRNHQELH